MTMSVMSANFLSEDLRRYERFQPQGRGYICTGEQDGGRNRGTSGEGSGGVHQVFERRSGAGGAAALDQGIAHCGGQDARTRQLHGETLGVAQVKRALAIVAM